MKIEYGQSKTASWCEAGANALLGYFVAIAAQKALFPLFGINVTTSTHLALGLCFTLISILRSYILRRVFNWFRLLDLSKVKLGLAHLSRGRNCTNVIRPKQLDHTQHQRVKCWPVHLEHPLVTLFLLNLCECTKC